MPDRLTAAQRRRCMQANRPRGTKLETAVMAALRRAGLRFKTHAAVPGTPDVAFPVQRVAVFIDGDFWHGWRFPAWSGDLPAYWRAKIERNRARDDRNFRKLRRMGWRVIRVWEHQAEADMNRVVTKVADVVRRRKPNRGTT